MFHRKLWMSFFSIWRFPTLIIISLFFSILTRCSSFHKTVCSLRHSGHQLPYSPALSLSLSLYLFLTSLFIFLSSLFQFFLSLFISLLYFFLSLSSCMSICLCLFLSFSLSHSLSPFVAIWLKALIKQRRRHPTRFENTVHARFRALPKAKKLKQTLWMTDYVPKQWVPCQ